MKNLNRKKYKKQIKEFRSTNKLAQVQHKWVKFYDEYNNEVLMFVHNSTIIRQNTNYPFNRWNCFNVGPHYAIIELYGHPSIANDHMNGVKIDVYNCGTTRFRVNKNNDFRILEDYEVNKVYHELFNKAENWFSKKFYVKQKEKQL